MAQQLGKMIVIDGLDGSGKGKQLDLLNQFFQKKGIRAEFTREPGGVPIAEEYRDIILKQSSFSPEGKNDKAYAHFAMFWIARMYHLMYRIKPTQESGVHVICDRFDSSTRAFQIGGEEHHELLKPFIDARKFMFGDWSPNLYVILDLAPEVAAERVKKDVARVQTHFDLRPPEYHARVRNGFREFSKVAPCVFINADQTPEEVHRDVLAALQPVLGF